ncbi:MAG: hypothetical protein NUV47_02510 [Patescibacteria group bacterium]|nr:hypothetical protein [Patescibacteria group bacterium]
MKRIVIGVIGIGLIYLSGCANVYYKSKNGDELRYSRLGFQSITDLEMEKKIDGSLSMKFNKQAGGENMGAIIGSALSTAMKGTK